MKRALSILLLMFLIVGCVPKKPEGHLCVYTVVEKIPPSGIAVHVSDCDEVWVFEVPQVEYDSVQVGMREYWWVPEAKYPWD